MRTVVCITTSNAPTSNAQGVADAELVVLFHMDGTWSVWKDRIKPLPDLPKRVPWDELPTHVKRNVPLYPEKKT